MKTQTKRSLGFIFGFKKTVQEGNSFVVKFTQGISEKFPKKHQNERDFWSMQIFEGDFSSLFIDPQEYIAGFHAELKEQTDDWMEELLQERLPFYTVVPSMQQFKVLNAWGQARLHVDMFQTWESKEEEAAAFAIVAGNLFKDDVRTLTEILQDDRSASAAAYEHSLKNLMF